MSVIKAIREYIAGCPLLKDGAIRTYCKAHRKFYDTVFGEPVSERIFAKIPDSIRKYNAIYAKFLAFIAGQSTAVRNETTEICEKYLPKGGKK